MQRQGSRCDKPVPCSRSRAGITIHCCKPAPLQGDEAELSASSNLEGQAAGVLKLLSVWPTIKVRGKDWYRLLRFSGKEGRSEKVG